MKSSLTAALVLAGSLGAASAAMAATPVVRHNAHHTMMRAEPTRAVPMKAPATVMSETPNPDPGLLGVFQASDGQIYARTVNDPRIHGLPQY